MTGALGRQAGRLLLAPWQWGRNHSGPWAPWYALALLLVLAGPPVAALVWLTPPVAWAVAGCMAVLGLTVVWFVQFGALLRLDHPHAAHAVPGHQRALRASALGLWLAMALLCGLGGAAWGRWAPEAAPGQPALLLALGMGSGLLLLALCMRWWWLWFVLCLAGVMPGVRPFWAAMRAVAAWAWQHWQAQPLGTTLLLMAVQGLLLASLFGAGDARHARAWGARERMRQAMAAGVAGRQTGLAAFGRWGAWLGQPWQRLADSWLARLCQRASPRQCSVLARAEVVLHGNQHWLPQVATGLLVQSILGLCFLLTIALSGARGESFIEHGRVGMGVGIATMALSAAFGLPGALWHSRREQALLLLLPGMPHGAALNRALARRRLQHALWLWLALLPALLALAWAGTLPGLVAFIAMALPVTAWMLWPDVSRLRPPGASTVVMPMLLCALGGVSSQWLLSRHPAALLPWGLAVLALTAGLLAWRWHRMASLPQALPAGRLA